MRLGNRRQLQGQSQPANSQVKWYVETSVVIEFIFVSQYAFACGFWEHFKTRRPFSWRSTAGTRTIPWCNGSRVVGSTSFRRVVFKSEQVRDQPRQGCGQAWLKPCSQLTFAYPPPPQFGQKCWTKNWICLQPLQKGVNFSRWSKWMATTPCFDKNYTISSISRSILNRFACNLNKRGLISRDDQNEWQQPHVLTKTAQYHQYLCQFVTDLLETFTIGG